MENIVQAVVPVPSSRVSTGKHLMTIVFGTWLIAGIFVDGFAHNHGVVETFFTPWHAILYSGFMASAIWMVWLLYRNRQATGAAWLQAAPEGYGLGLIGVAVFLVGGLCDMAWHTIFGIEQDIAALLSPSHLLLLVGAGLILSSPFRAAWKDSGLQAPEWRVFAPPLLSLVLTVGAASFFLMYAWMFRYNLPAKPVTDWYMGKFYSGHIAHDNEMRGLSYILLDTAMLMFPVFLLMKRWIVPTGTITALFTIIATLMNVLDGFEYYPSIILAFASGLAGDVIYRWLRPYEGRLLGYRVIAIAVPVVMWSFYFVWMYASVGIGWEIEFWTGAIVEAALASLVLSLLAISPKQG